MAIEVIEKIDSRESTTGKSATVDLTYIITGTSDDIAAKAALAATAPSYYDGLVRQSRHITPVGDPTETLTWEGTARYAPKETSPPSTGESSYSFDTSGGNQHITQSIHTAGSYAPSGETAPDFKGGIGVTRDNVEGVDITVPVYHFSETHLKPDSEVTLAYRGTLFQLTGKVNDAAFRGCDAGECLFLGASGSKRGDDEWEIQFRFAALPNKSSLTVGSISGISKKGWEYMWVLYSDEEDTTAKRLVKRPVAVYIEKVYETAGFSGLGI